MSAGRSEGLGRVARAHGRDGSFYVDSPTRLLEVGETVLLSGREHLVERRAGTDARPILRVSGIGDRDAAAAVRGETLADPVPSGEMADGEWRVEDLLGCRVEGLGEVRRVIAAPSCDVLEVGEEGVLVPLVGDAVTRVDTEERVIEIDRRFLGLPDPVEAEAGAGPSSDDR